MSDLIKLYNGTVTKDAADGTELSQNGTQTNPLSFTLNAAKEESSCQQIAIRCASGYKTYGDTVITAYHYNSETKKYEPNTGDTAKWFFAVGEYDSAANALTNAAWSNKLTISDVITDKNTLIWVKAASSKAEVPANDTDESIHIEAVIEQA